MKIIKPKILKLQTIKVKKGNIINDVQSDIKLKILLEQHDKFKRSGLDLILTKEINFKESLCGFEFVIEHLTGKSFKLVITGGFSNLYKSSIKTKVIHNKEITIKGLIKISKLIR